MSSSAAARVPDLLTWPVLGRFLKRRHARLAMQTPLLLVAGLIVFDGLFGPQLAPKNLATVGVWLHYRGLVVVALLVAGNLFCMACPFMLPRRIGRWLRRFWGGGRPIPTLLRSKWPALALLVLYFFVYERFSLWASPWLTAWIVLAYFVAAFAVDAVFHGAAFCKYVCPVGQFNFFSSLVSPLEISVRDASACASCRTKDCIRGARGCELALFQPRKVGNLDCTFCLDCVHACPYDNIGIRGRIPTAELWDDPFRSGIGRLSRRPDVALLVVILVFGSFINAFAMIPPVYTLRGQIARWLGGPAPTAELALIFAIGLLILPTLALAAAGWATQRQLIRQQHMVREVTLSGSERQISASLTISEASRGGNRDASAQTTGLSVTRAPAAEPLTAVVGRFVYALVPLGFGMWLAHYSFHFLTGGQTLVPVAQSFAADIGLWRGAVQWGLGPVVPGEWLFPIEALLLYAGAFGAIISAVQIARRWPEAAGKALPAAAPWILLILALLAAGLAILVQPMEMRGTFQAPGGAGG
jgi:ferredoxin